MDWERKSVEFEMVVKPENPAIDDPNPGGSTRGGRGIEVVDNEIVVAAYHTLKIFDMDLRHQRDISHRLFVDLHELRMDENQNLLVTCTAIDAVFLFDLKTETILKEYWPREMPDIQKYLDIEPLQLNAVAKWRGEVYAYFNRYGVVVNLDTGQVVLEDPKAKIGHNLIILDDGTAFINDSNHQFLYVFDLKTGQQKKAINLIPFHHAAARKRQVHRYVMVPMRKLARATGLYQPKVVSSFYVRGMDMVDDLLFIGISPAAILCVDWKREELVDVFDYSTDVAHAVHGVKVVKG